MAEEFLTLDLSINERISPIRFHLSDDYSDKIVREWARTREAGLAVQKSSIYAEAAFLRYRSYVDMGHDAVSTFDDARRTLRTDRKQEIQLKVVGHIDSQGEATICFAMLRRTWTGNLVIDYLAAGPDIVSRRVACPGIGRAILRAVLEVARRMDCPLVWVETAADSYAFYQRNFGLAEESDLVIVETEAAIRQIEPFLK